MLDRVLGLLRRIGVCLDLLAHLGTVQDCGSGASESVTEVYDLEFNG